MNKSKVFGLSLPSRNNSTDLADINVISNNFSLLDSKIPEKIEDARKKVINETRNEVYGAISYFEGEYNNILRNVEEDSTTDNPIQFPAHKTGVFYEHSWAYKFTADENLECYIFEAKAGDRFNISGYDITSGSARSAYIAILDSNFGQLQRISTVTTNIPQFCLGILPCPENTAYVVINKAIDDYTPIVTRVDEPVLQQEAAVPNASKFMSPLYNGVKTLSIDGSVSNTLTFTWTISDRFTHGVYPLEAGVEYVIYVPEATDYHKLACICNADMVVNAAIDANQFDSNKCYTFTAGENDKYIALNCYNYSGTMQFGKKRSDKIKAGIKIGGAFYDGMHDITLQDMGVIDRNLTDIKWVSYGDSITFGVGVDFVNGEKLWQDYIVDRYNINHVKMGEGYTSLAHRDVEVGECYCHDSRLNALINELPDIVTILGGANDYRFNIPIGTDDDVTNKNIYTFKGAYAYILDKILTAKPDTTILLLGMFKNAMGDYGEGKGTYPLKDYATATKEIAEHFGLPFVDLNECGFNAYNFNTTDGVFSTDGIHPNAEGVKRIAMVVSKWFDSFRGTVFDKKAETQTRSNTDYLYESYDVDKATFPYVMVGCTDKGDGKVQCQVYFANKFSDTNGRVIIPQGRTYKYLSLTQYITADINNQDDIVDKIVAYNASVSQGTASSSPAYTNAGTTAYYTNDTADTFTFVPKYLT
jgi:lysophospholipase L1-like esterase